VAQKHLQQHIQRDQHLDVLQLRIVATLAYTDQCSYPLTREEIVTRCVSTRTLHEVFGLGGEKNGLDDTAVSAARVDGVLEELVKQGCIEQQDAFFFLRGRGECVQVRRRRQAAAHTRSAELHELAKLLTRCPWIESAWLTGSLAMQSAEAQDDIDICVVAQPGAIWRARIWVAIMTQLRGKRRARTSHTNGWCFNLWLDRSTLTIPSFKQHAYTAYEILQATPLVLTQHTRTTQLLDANPWALQWLPHLTRTTLREDYARRQVIRPHRPRGARATSLNPSFFARTCEFVLYVIQRIYMRAHQTRELVHAHAAYFHPRDTQSLIYRKWQATMQHSVVQHGTAVPQPRTHTNQWSLEQTVQAVRTARQAGQSIILATGVFDVLHPAHSAFLRAAAKLGYFVVGLERDARVRQLKGPDRPINTEHQRLANLAALNIANGVFLLPTQFSQPSDYETFIRKLHPDILAVSSHSPHLEKKAAVMAKVGGSVQVVMEQDPEHSTTQILARRT
jgi:cytidyltransferase-like protein